jgi:hypothetical protein
LEWFSFLFFEHMIELFAVFFVYTSWKAYKEAKRIGSINPEKD